MSDTETVTQEIDQKITRLLAQLEAGEIDKIEVTISSEGVKIEGKCNKDE